MEKMKKSTDARLGVLRTLITHEEIMKRTEELAEQINREYAGKNLVLIGTLKGGVPFFSALLERITLPCRTDFVSAASYGASTSTSGKVTLNNITGMNVEGMDVLLVEDIVDSGRSLERLTAFLEGQKPASYKIIALLDKPSRREVPYYADYVGFTIDDYFVIGFGLDYNQYYRNLPDVCVIDPAYVEG